MESRFVHKLISYSGIRSQKSRSKKSKSRKTTSKGRRPQQRRDQDYVPRASGSSATKKFSKATTTPLVRYEREGYDEAYTVDVKSLFMMLFSLSPFQIRV